MFHRIMVDEDSFRSFHLKNDSIQARIGVGLLIAPLALFSFKDYDFFRLSPEFYGLAALRLCVISLCLWLIYKLGRIRDYRKYDRCLFLVGLAVIAAVSLINLSRPPGYYLFIMLDMSVIAVIYTIIPTRPVNQLILGSLFTTIDLFIFVFTRDKTVHAMFVTIIPGLLLINIVGMTSSWLLQIFRRGQFAAQTEQEKIQKKLTALTLQLQTAQAVTGVGSWTYSPETSEVTWSDEMYRIYGITPADKITAIDDHSRFMSHENWQKLRSAISLVIETGTPYELEMEITCSGGTSKTLLSRGQLILPPDIFSPLLIGTSQDITENKRKEKIISDSLKEKEALLREIRHRVKNNLQVMSSLLSIQSQFIVDQKDARMLQESQDRIHSMSLVYNQLCLDQNLADINLREYIREIASNLILAYGHTASISLLIEGDEIRVSLDIAIPCGLMVNELITNSLKHAFAGRQNGTISILTRKNRSDVDLIVRDDGIGLPQGFDASGEPTLGMTLVRTLAEQLGAGIELSNDGGVVFHSCFCSVAPD